MKQIRTSIMFVVPIVLIFAVCALCVPRRMGMEQPTVYVTEMVGVPVLVIDWPDHSPIYMREFTVPKFNYSSSTLRIERTGAPLGLHPFSELITRPPLVIRQGFFPGEYRLLYWNGKEDITLGALSVGAERQLTLK
jgi:hypothetical protein